VSLPRDDLDLIDALVWARVITRETASVVAQNASPGRVATYIGEKGIHSVHAFSHLLIERIARSEGWQQTLAGALEQINKHDNTLRGMPMLPLRMPSEYAPGVMSCVICLQRDAAVGRGGCAECLPPEQPETD
jgi:hypothetical protein